MLMVYNLAILVAIPLILVIVTVSPFDSKEEPDTEIIFPEEKPNFAILFFTLLTIWILLMIKTLYLLRKCRHAASTKFWIRFITQLWRYKTHWRAFAIILIISTLVSLAISYEGMMPFWVYEWICFIYRQTRVIINLASGVSGLIWSRKN